MTNILIVYEIVEPCNIEIARIFGLLQEEGLLLRRFKTATEVCKNDLIWCDVMLFVRSTSLIELNLITLGKKLGKYIILMMDDDFLSLNNDYGVFGEGYWPERQRILKKNLCKTDCLMAVNELLAKKYVDLGNIPKYALSNTVIEKSEIFSTKQNGLNGDKIKIAFYVNDGTQDMFNNILRPVIPMICEKYPNQVTLFFLALEPNMDEFKDKIVVNYVPHMPYRDFKIFLGTSGIDIGLAPLVDAGFSCYKYFNKYVEYTLAGIPAIYSDCLLYSSVIKNGFNGMVCGNTPKAWFEAISRLIEKPALRKSLIDNAQSHIYENFQSDKVLTKLLKDIPEIVGYKSKEISMPLLTLRLKLIYLNYIIFRMRGWFITARNYIRKGNIMPLIRRFNQRIIKGNK